MKEIYTKPESMIEEFKTADVVMTVSMDPDEGIENIPGGSN